MLASSFVTTGGIQYTSNYYTILPTIGMLAELSMLLRVPGGTQDSSTRKCLYIIIKLRLFDSLVYICINAAKRMHCEMGRMEA